VQPLVAVAIGGGDDPAPVAQHRAVAGSGRGRRRRRGGRAGGGGEGGEDGEDQGPGQARHAALPWVAAPPSRKGRAGGRERTEASLGPVPGPCVKRTRPGSGGQASALVGGSFGLAARGAAFRGRGLGLSGRGRAVGGGRGRAAREARQGGRRLVGGGRALGARPPLAAGHLVDLGGRLLALGARLAVVAVAPFPARLVVLAVAVLTVAVLAFLVLALAGLGGGDAVGLGLLGGEDGGGLGPGLVLEIDVEALAGQFALGDLGHRARGLQGAQDAEIVFGVLGVVLGQDAVAAGR